MPQFRGARGGLDTSVPVVVLGAGYGGLAVARSLGRVGVPVYVVEARVGRPSLASRYWKKAFRWDLSTEQPHSSVEFLLDIGACIGNKGLIMPTTDVSALFVAEHAAELQARFIISRQSASLTRALLNKRELHALLQRLGLPFARTAFPMSEQGLLEAVEETGLPAIVKAISPVVPPGKTKLFVKSRKEVLRLIAPAMVGHGNVLIQEYIPGGEDSNWFFDGYFNRQTRCLAAGTGQSIRRWSVHTGVASLAVSRPNRSVEKSSLTLAQAIGYQGLVDIDFRHDRRTGEYKIVDVNPRIGAAFRLFLTRDGRDLATVCYMDMTGQPVPVVEPLEGRKWWLEEDIFSSLRDRRERDLTFLAWVRSLAGVQEAAWFAVDDLAPFCGWLQSHLGSSLNVLTRQLTVGRKAGSGSHGRTANYV